MSTIWVCFEFDQKHEDENDYFYIEESKLPYSLNNIAKAAAFVINVDNDETDYDNTKTVAVMYPASRLASCERVLVKDDAAMKHRSRASSIELIFHTAGEYRDI